MDKLSITQNTNKYTAKIINISKNIDLSNFISECNISLPKTNEISSMSANFTLDEKLIDTGNEIRIEILDEVDNILYSLQGLATLEKRSKKYTGQESYQYSVKDSYDKLFDKVVPETVVFFDLFFCNVNDKHNSLLHIVAEKLGFREEQLDFVDITYSDGSLIRVPFILFEQDERWIDILQRFIKATDSILYIRDKKLFCRPRNFDLNASLEFNRTNIITEIEETFKSTQYNGIRVSYDRFIKLENQVVFNLSQKIIVDENKAVGSEAQAMRITYSTSSVSNPTLTKATAYYFSTPGDVNSKVNINLVKDTHYVIEEWKETQAIVKFYNPYQHKLYIDNFEIKGLPLVKYQDNESIIKNPNITEKHQENFITIQKNREVQTEKLAKHIALSEYKAQIVNNKEYSFNTHFLKDVELGGVYSLSIEDIQTVIRVNNIQIHLRPSQFSMKIQAECVKESSEFTYSSVLSGKSNTNFVDLKSIEEKIEKNEKDLKILDRDIKSKLFKQKTQPDSSEVKENDIWLNPETNVWKKFYNGVWNSISEDEILPSMKMYNSVDTNVIKLQGTADKVGAYLLNDGEKFGSLNGELAHVTFDKLGQFEAINPNNKIALNIKDPANPSVVKSQILLGVTDVTDEKYKDVSFQVGDESSGHFIQFRNGEAKVFDNGKTISDVNSALDTGDFTITGRTNFDGSARFISRGTNEVITIANGSIDFHRDGQRLTKIKNINYGVIATDSKGKGIVNFAGFKQPMVVLTTIKSANFGKNMASIFCYAEHIQGAQYRFYVGGTNEHYTEAKPVKVVGNTWTMNNVVITTLLGITGNIPEYIVSHGYPAMLNATFGNYGVRLQKKRVPYFSGNQYPNRGIIKRPSFNVKIWRNSEVLFNQNYTPDVIIDFKKMRATFGIRALDFSKTMNILKRYSARTNVTYRLEITILEKDLVVESSIDFLEKHGSGDDKYYEHWNYLISGKIFELTPSYFKGLSITASAETSTLSGVTGTGEVQYIAMEID